MTFDKYKILRDAAAAVATQKPTAVDPVPVQKSPEPIQRESKPTQNADLSIGQDSASLAKELSQAAQVFSKPESKQIFLEGSAQVPVVYSKTEYTPVTGIQLDPTLAGSSTHAPDRRRRERRKIKGSKDHCFRMRIPGDIKAKLEAKAAAAESYPSAYVLKLIASNLCLPINEAQTSRSRGLQEQIAGLTVALNKTGGLFNQIAAALNRGQPCPVTRQEITDAWRRHIAATNAIIKLGFD